MEIDADNINLTIVAILFKLNVAFFAHKIAIFIVDLDFMATITEK